MPKIESRVAASLLLVSALNACIRTSPDLASTDAAGNRAAISRGAADVYPSGTRETAEASHAARADPLSRDAVSDAMITARIRAAIATDPGMAGADVSVNTDGGVVSLTGTVKSQEQAAFASAHAQRYDGIMRVDSHLSTLPQ
jgi:osmotically-inducible protein OsmY